jgi:hypothetical protein
LVGQPARWRPLLGDTVSLILFSIVCGVGGQLALRVGMGQVGRIGAQALAQPLSTALRVGTSPYVVGGLAL